jgi:hypothetical protein
MRPRLGRPSSAEVHGPPRRGTVPLGGNRRRSTANGLRFVVAGSLALLACHDAAREEAEREARDRTRLETILNADEALDRALKSADDVSRAGNDEKAAALLEGEATRASAIAVAEAEREPLETQWGRARRDAILAVMRERQAAIAPYAKAIRGEDLDAKLSAVETQIALQKKALDVATAALSGPVAPPPISPDGG